MNLCYVTVHMAMVLCITHMQGMVNMYRSKHQNENDIN